MTTLYFPMFKDGLRAQFRVFGSLILREINARYGRENIGFLWFVAEPLMFGSVIAMLHKLNHQTNFSGDITALPFTIVGYSIFIIFRNIFNKSEGMIEGAAPLFYHRMVSVFDVVVSKMVVDVVGCIFAVAILLGFSASIGAAPLPYRPLQLLSAIGLMVWWTAGLTMIAASVVYRNEVIGRQVHVLSYFVIPVSGSFWQMSWLPVWLSDYLQWFPMPLIFEQARYGMFRSAPDRYVDPGYVALWCAGLTYTGILLLRRRRRTIHG